MDLCAKLVGSTLHHLMGRGKLFNYNRDEWNWNICLSIMKEDD